MALETVSRSRHMVDGAVHVLKLDGTRAYVDNSVVSSVNSPF